MYNTSAKVLEIDALVRKCNAWRVKGDQVVLTVGHFAQLGAREVDLLESARDHGHRLVVVQVPSGDAATDADSQRILTGLFATDAVCIVSADELPFALSQLKPEVLATDIDSHFPAPQLPAEVPAKVVSLSA